MNHSSPIARSSRNGTQPPPRSSFPTVASPRSATSYGTLTMHASSGPWAGRRRLLVTGAESRALKPRGDAFYKGDTAERIVEFITGNPVEDASGAAHTGLLTYEDISEWRATVEEPVTLNYRGLDVHKCPPWTQGPVFLQQLAILEGFDLGQLGHNTADYLHSFDRDVEVGVRRSGGVLRRPALR